MRNAAEEYHAEFAAKEATIAALGAEADAGRARMQAEIEKLRRDMEARARPDLNLNPLPSLVPAAQRRAWILLGVCWRGVGGTWLLPYWLQFFPSKARCTASTSPCSRLGGRLCKW